MQVQVGLMMAFLSHESSLFIRAAVCMSSVWGIYWQVRPHMIFGADAADIVCGATNFMWSNFVLQ